MALYKNISRKTFFGRLCNTIITHALLVKVGLEGRGLPTEKIKIQGGVLKIFISMVENRFAVKEDS